MSNSIELRHDFYETDEKVIISILDKGAQPKDVSITIAPRNLTFEHGDKKLVLDPLTGEVDPDRSGYTVGKVRIEVRLMKKSQGRWTKLVGGNHNETVEQSAYTNPIVVPARPKPQKNWEGIVEDSINPEPGNNINEDPNAGGDTAVNGFFQQLFADADDDTRRAMMKSYQESGGTSLSTNWAEVGKQKMEVQPPAGSEWRKWG